MFEGIALNFCFHSRVFIRRANVTKPQWSDAFYDFQTIENFLKDNFWEYQKQIVVFEMWQGFKKGHYLEYYREKKWPAGPKNVL